jgi:hypothetical protein
MKSLLVSIIGICIISVPSINWRHKIFVSIFFGSFITYSISRDWKAINEENNKLEENLKNVDYKIKYAVDREAELNAHIERETKSLNEQEKQLKVRLAIDETNCKRDIENKLKAAELEVERIIAAASTKLSEREKDLEAREVELETRKQLLEKELEELKLQSQHRAGAITSEAEEKAENIINDARLKSEQLEVEKREELLAKDSNFQLKIIAYESDLLKLNQEQSSLREEKIKTQIEHDRILAEARLEAGKLRETTIAEINKEREDFNQKQASEKAKLQSEMHSFELIRIQTGAELEKDRALFDAHASREQALLDQSKAAWEREREELRAIWQQQCQEEMNEAVDQEVAIKLDAQLKAKMQPHLQEMAHLKNVIDELKQRLAAKERDLEELRSPRLLKDATPDSAYANRLIDFYWRRGVGLNAVNRYWKEQYFVAVVETFEGVTRKKITDLFDVVAWEFKLSAPPSINVSSEGYEISMLPVPLPFMGQRPPIYEEDVIRALNTDYAIHQPEHLNYDYSEVNNQISLEQKKEQMLSFIPPDRLPSGKGQILPIEYTIVEWYYKWHKAATGQPNITRINDLINMTYGVKVGRSSEAQDPASGYTLRQRIHKILEDLGIKQNECK